MASTVFLVVISTCSRNWQVQYSCRHYNMFYIGKYVFLVVITTCSRHWQVQYSWSSLHWQVQYSWSCSRHWQVQYSWSSFQHVLEIGKYSIPGRSRHWQVQYSWSSLQHVLEIGKYIPGRPTTCSRNWQVIPGRITCFNIGKYSIPGRISTCFRRSVFLVVISTCPRHWQVQYSWSSFQHVLDWQVQYSWSSFQTCFRHWQTVFGRHYNMVTRKYSIPGRHYNMYGKYSIPGRQLQHVGHWQVQYSWSSLQHV